MSTASSSRVVLRLLAVGLAVLALGAAGRQDRLSRGHRWVATWTASVQGPYPSGNPSAQPVLDFAFESPQRGATDQTFRLVVKPDLWGARIRLRFANTFGSQPLTLDDIYVGLQSSGGNIADGTSEPVTFNGRRSMTIPSGRSLYTDPVTLRFVNRTGPSLLRGRRLAVSFHTPGSTGPMTWHAKALTTSYISAPGAGSHSADETDTSFPFTTTSWYFLDAIDVLAADDTMVVACFGDSITDGTGSTLNGDDRWPDVLARRLHAAYGGRVSVVNAGIGGNQVTGPAAYNPAAPFAGGPSALERMDRDIFGIASLSTVVWLEGINDLAAGASAETVIAGLREGIRRLHAHGGVRVIGATITSSVGATTASGTPDVDTRRQAINAFIRTGGTFDGFIDFDAATRDPQSGGLRAVFQPNSTIGGAGDRLHPNRAGYQAMGHAIDLRLFAPRVGR